jgi:transcriptional regulator with XRE-family HTH domain
MSNWLARKLQELFATPGLTVQKVAEDTGIPRSYLSLMKTGRQIPSEDVVRKLARYFGEDEEEWAFNTKGQPVIEDLQRKYPTAMPKYARKLRDEPPTGGPYKLTWRTYAATHGGKRGGPPDWRTGEFIPLDIIETYANDALRLFSGRLGDDLFPLDAEFLVRELFNLEVFYDDGRFMDAIGTNLLGCLFADGMPCPATGTDRVIMVNDSPRFRSVTSAFTIVHELGHYLFHYPKDAIAPTTASYCRSGDVQPAGATSVPPREWQASRFASELLMPKDKVRWLLDGRPPGDIINLELYGDNFRRFFGVSQAAMEKRLYDLGYKCAMGRYAYANVTRVGPR